MRKALLIFIPLLSFFHRDLLPKFPNQDQMEKPDIIAHEIIDKTSKKLKKKYGLHPIGVGFSGKFKFMEISFEIDRPLTKDEARSILIDSVKVFAKNINSDQRIRPYLLEYPFTEKNAGVTLYIKTIDRREPVHPNLCLASSKSNGVNFKTIDPENTNRYKEQYYETHEEAFALAKKPPLKTSVPALSSN